MNILVTILVVIVSIVVLILLIALFVKKDYSILREVIISKPKQQVFDYIKYLKNQDNYSIWVMMDPAMRKEFKGIDGTVGFVSAWESDNKKVGKGEQEIKKIIEGERMDLHLHFIKPFEGRAEAYMTTNDMGDSQTKVVWGVNSKMAYPMNIMLLFMNMEKIIGKDLETGLTNLKQIMEK